MSASAIPISPAQFASALRDLSLPSCHAKAAEIHNSIAHLLSSNAELDLLAAEGDVDCIAAVAENEEVIGRMRSRLEILRREVEGRGAIWIWGSLDSLAAGEGKGAGVDGGEVNGYTKIMIGDEQRADEHINGVSGEAEGDTMGAAQSTTSGRLTDEELQRRMQEQMDLMQDGGEDEDGGMHL